jgi:hypothetical protein
MICSPLKVCEALPRLAAPPNVCEGRANITAGRGALFRAFIRSDKADKSCKDFCFFATFFSKKKVDRILKAESF